MSYSLKSESADELVFSRSRSLIVILIALIVIGFLALCFGGLATLGGAVGTGLMVCGGGMLFFFGGWLGIIQRHLLPSEQTLDNQAGRFRFSYRNGDQAELGYGDIAGAQVRQRGRGHLLTSLIRRNGGVWDLHDSNSARRADAMRARIETFLAGARSRTEHYPQLKRVKVVEETNGGRSYRWQNRSSVRVMILALFLVLAVALVLGGAAIENEWHEYVVYGVALLYLCFVLYAFYSMLRELFVEHVIHINSQEIAWLRLPPGRSFSDARSKKKRRMAISDVAQLRYHFDIMAGVQCLYVLDREDSRAAAPEWGVGRFFSGLMQPLRLFRIPLYGLNAIDGLALEVDLRNHAKRLGASIVN